MSRSRAVEPGDAGGSSSAGTGMTFSDASGESRRGTAEKTPPRKRRRPQPADPGDGPTEVPITRLTVIPARMLDATNFA